MLAADEKEIPLDKEDAHRMEVLVLKQQLATSQLQLLRAQLYTEYLKQEGARDLEKELRELQRETTALMRLLYREADLDILEYSLNLDDMVFERIETEEPPEIAEVGGQE